MNIETISCARQQFEIWIDLSQNHKNNKDYFSYFELLCARFALALFAVQGKNFLMMDEPLNHQDIESREQFSEALFRYQGTVLAVVYDRYFSDQVADVIWKIKDRKISVS